MRAASVPTCTAFAPIAEQTSTSFAAGACKPLVRAQPRPQALATGTPPALSPGQHDPRTQLALRLLRLSLRALSAWASFSADSSAQRHRPVGVRQPGQWRMHGEHPQYEIFTACFLTVGTPYCPRAPSPTAA